ncbi:MAG: LacI family DNA-binding transcriptional regulator [Verrucomicrobiota bacterium]|nr:LacI family DNA-binding transcriptional regulator [Verrucomicrobiota bacterium]
MHADSPKAPRITHRDIANRLGISQSTISRVLSNHPKVSPDTRKLVLQAVEAMHYRPDPALSVLAAHRWPEQRARTVANLAYIILAPRTEYCGSVGSQAQMRVVRNRAEELGFGFDCFWLSDYPSGRELSKVLYHRGIEGLILTGDEEQSRINLEWSHFCHVALGEDTNLPLCNRVRYDWFDALLKAIDRALERGYKRIGIALMDHQNSVINQALVSGCFIAGQKLSMLGLPILPTATFQPNQTDGKPLREWFHENQPDVVISSNIRAYYLMDEAGIQFPKAAGFVYLHRSHSPGEERLSAMDDLCSLRVSRTVELLAQLIHLNQKGILKYPRIMLIQGEWYEGETLPDRHTESVPLGG